MGRLQGAAAGLWPQAGSHLSCSTRPLYPRVLGAEQGSAACSGRAPLRAEPCTRQAGSREGTPSPAPESGEVSHGLAGMAWAWPQRGELLAGAGEELSPAGHWMSSLLPALGEVAVGSLADGTGHGLALSCGRRALLSPGSCWDNGGIWGLANAVALVRGMCQGQRTAAAAAAAAAVVGEGQSSPAAQRAGSPASAAQRRWGRVPQGAQLLPLHRETSPLAPGQGRASPGHARGGHI